MVEHLVSTNMPHLRRFRESRGSSLEFVFWDLDFVIWTLEFV